MEAINEHEQQTYDLANRQDLYSELNQTMLDRKNYLRERLLEFGDGELDAEKERIREWYLRQLERLDLRDNRGQRLKDYVGLFGNSEFGIRNAE